MCEAKEMKVSNFKVVLKEKDKKRDSIDNAV